MTHVTPPGYAENGAHAEPELAFPLGSIALAVGALVTTFYEVCIAAPAAYSAPDATQPVALFALAGLLLGAVARARNWVRLDAARGFALLACFAALSAHAMCFAFAHGDWLPRLTACVPLLGGALCGLVGLALFVEHARALAALEALSWLSNPFRLALGGALWLGLVLTFPGLGILRRAALLSAFLAAASVVLPFVARLLGRVDARLSWPSWLAPFAALASLVAAEGAVPREPMRRHTGDVVYVLDQGRGEHVISRSQGGMLLFSDDVLTSTSTDAERFAEALVHPAFALAQHRRVLVFDDAAGNVLAQALAFRDLQKLVVVPHDPALARLARDSRWFHAVQSDARLEWVLSEAAPWLAAHSDRFDVIVMNASDPSSYRSGKYFTRHWFELVRAHLSSQGVFALQLTSPLRTPGAHASILATLESAGFAPEPYRAALPTLGEWGFALAFVERRALSERLAQQRPLPRTNRYVTATTLPHLFSGSTSLDLGNAAVNHLFDQPLVELYRHEDDALND